MNDYLLYHYDRYDQPEDEGVCPNCHGTGEVDGEPCQVCGGDGMIL